MTVMKTAISIPKHLFDRVETLAEEMQVPRSQVFALAAEEFVQRRDNLKMLRELNEAYGDAKGESDRRGDEDELLLQGMRRRQAGLLEGQW